MVTYNCKCVLYLFFFLVGKHIDFCCHIKRGNDKRGSNPTYEYVKLILTLKDIANGKQFSFQSNLDKVNVFHSPSLLT